MINIQAIIQEHMDAGLCREYAVLEARKELEERSKIADKNAQSKRTENNLCKHLLKH